MLTGAAFISFFILAAKHLYLTTQMCSYVTSLLTIAVSLDSMGWGLLITRGTRITALSGIIIALCTAVMMCISMTAGNFSGVAPLRKQELWEVSSSSPSVAGRSGVAQLY